jgi:hypothetical protein
MGPKIVPVVRGGHVEKSEASSKGPETEGAESVSWQLFNNNTNFGIPSANVDKAKPKESLQTHTGKKKHTTSTEPPTKKEKKSGKAENEPRQNRMNNCIVSVLEEKKHERVINLSSLWRCPILRETSMQS